MTVNSLWRVNSGTMGNSRPGLCLYQAILFVKANNRTSINKKDGLIETRTGSTRETEAAGKNYSLYHCHYRYLPNRHISCIVLHNCE